MMKKGWWVVLAEGAMRFVICHQTLVVVALSDHLKWNWCLEDPLLLLVFFVCVLCMCA